MTEAATFAPVVIRPWPRRLDEREAATYLGVGTSKFRAGWSAATPMRSMTILYDRAGRPFQSLPTLRERINDVLARPAVQAIIDAAIDNDDLPAGVTLHPHGLRKNAACNLLEAGLNEEEIGTLTGMSPDMVRHYTKRINARRIAVRVGQGAHWAKKTTAPK